MTCLTFSQHKIRNIGTVLKSKNMAIWILVKIRSFKITNLRFWKFWLFSHFLLIFVPIWPWNSPKFQSVFTSIFHWISQGQKIDNFFLSTQIEFSATVGGRIRRYEVSCFISRFSVFSTFTKFGKFWLPQTFKFLPIQNSNSLTLILCNISQCGKLMIFLSLRFYVKSILVNLEVLKLSFLQF